MGKKDRTRSKRLCPGLKALGWRICMIGHIGHQICMITIIVVSVTPHPYVILVRVYTSKRLPYEHPTFAGHGIDTVSYTALCRCLFAPTLSPDINQAALSCRTSDRVPLLSQDTHTNFGILRGMRRKRCHAEIGDVLWPVQRWPILSRGVLARLQSRSCST